MVLQHPSEVKHAKNTARLVKLGLPECDVIVGETESDFDDLKRKVLADPLNFHVFYPSEQSRPIEQHLDELSTCPPENMLFIDSTWRKALKIWHLNPWIKSCQQWHFSNPPDGHYQIRKTRVERGLSTLEAVVHGLELCYEFDGSSVLRLFSAMQTHHLEYKR